MMNFAFLSYTYACDGHLLKSRFYSTEFLIFARGARGGEARRFSFFNATRPDRFLSKADADKNIVENCLYVELMLFTDSSKN